MELRIGVPYGPKGCIGAGEGLRRGVSVGFCRDGFKDISAALQDGGPTCCIGI